MPEVVAITGASAGVGRAAVREFAKRSPGARIGLLARNGDGLEGARREVEAAGGEALVISTDVADAGQVEEAARSPRCLRRGGVREEPAALGDEAPSPPRPLRGGPRGRGVDPATREEGMRPDELSEQLRRGTGPFLARRRRVASLALAAAGSMGLISLSQLGVIKHLPDPPLPYFDSDKVDASEEAYSVLSMPDAPIGLGSYAATLGLAAMGGEDRATERPWIPLALAAKAAFDALQAGKLTVDQWTQHRAFCLWCLLAAGCTFATVPLAIPEARAALRHLSRGSS